MEIVTLPPFMVLDDAIRIVESMGVKRAFLGDACLEAPIVYIKTDIERTPEGPKVSYSIVSGMVTTFERVPAIPHTYILFAVNYAEPTKNAPNDHIWMWG
jgi:hypothetical protein